MDQADAYLAIARDPAFDWRAPTAGLADLQLLVRVAWGMTSVVQVAQAISSGTFPGRQLDWGAWIACVTKAQARTHLEAHRWPVSPEFDALPDDEPYYLVAFES
jgi:hypothetical protein